MMAQGVDFAFETTLATRSFTGLIDRAKAQGYTVTLIYYWLDSVELAVARVKARVAEGGRRVAIIFLPRSLPAAIKRVCVIFYTCTKAE